LFLGEEKRGKKRRKAMPKEGTDLVKTGVKRFGWGGSGGLKLIKSQRTGGIKVSQNFVGEMWGL